MQNKENQPNPTQDVCVKGINWGKSRVDSDSLSIDHGSQNLLKIPFSKIINSSVLNKHEVVLEFKNPEEIKPDDDVLCEMRFYLPPSLNEMKEEKKENSEGEKMDVEPQQTLAELLNNDIVNKAKMGQFSSESIATFPEIPLVVPRGKYAADLYKDCIRFHGSTFNYKIDFKTIERAFLLPKPDDVHMVFILALKSPLRQGNTSYPYIVMHFKKDLEQEIKIRLKPEQMKDYGDSLKDEYNGALYDIVSKLFKVIVGVNIIIPGNFKSSTGHSGFRCSLKAHEGYLFPLQKSLIFIMKPVIYLKVDDISVAEFHRINKGTSTLCKLFDLELKRKDRGASQLFVGIDKQEFQLLVNYFETRKVKVEIVDEQNDKFDDNTDEEIDDPNGLKKRKSNPIKEKMMDKYMQNLDDEDESEDEDYKAEEQSEDDDGSESSVSISSEAAKKKQKK